MAIPEGLSEFYDSNQPARTILERYGYNPKRPQAIVLKKALYSLKQSPRQWQGSVISLLESCNFSPLISDSAVYYNRKKQIFVVTYVDDFLLIGPSSSDIQALKARLARAYAIEDRGPADYFLGVQIRRDRSKGILSLSQTQYIEEALDYFNLSNPRTIQVPLQASLLTEPSTKEAPNNAYPPEYLSKTETQQYQSIVGTVMYLMTQTRPDITFTVQ